MKNPFTMKVVHRPDSFCNRSEEIATLCSYANSNTNTVIFSPRRFGKTSLVFQVQRQLIRSGFLTIYIDLFGLSSADNIARRITKGVYSAIYKEKTVFQKAIEIIKSHKPVLRPDATGVSISAECVRPNLAGDELLDRTLGELGEFIAEGKKPTNIVLDEFQEITEIRDRNIEGIMRSHIQNQQAGYFFVGSRRRVLLEMFNQSRRPFFQSALNFELEKLPHDELSEFISRRFKDSGKQCSLETASRIAESIDDHPYYCQKLAFFCFEVSDKTITSKNVQEGFNELLHGEKPVFEAILQGLASQQIALLRAIAKQPSKSILSIEYMRKHNLKSIGGVQSAAGKLERLDLIERNAGNTWQLVDPLLERWLRR